MNDFFANLVGEALAPWLSGLVVLLFVGLALWILLAMVSRYRQSVFVSGGRKNRLEVIDATAIDDRRRLVLVRRDDVEHLVMIGGHNDVVIEQGIGAEAKPEVPTITPPSRKPQTKPAANTDNQMPVARNKRPAMMPEEPTIGQPAKAVRQTTKTENKAATVAALTAASLATAADEKQTSDIEAPQAAVKAEPMEAAEPKIQTTAAGEAPFSIDSIDLDDALADMDFSELDNEVVTPKQDVAAASQAKAETSGEASLEGEMEKLLSELTVQR
ncbi:MAG: hypothetical protein AAFR27_05045 [Pseudomonadota bacterium]